MEIYLQYSITVQKQTHLGVVILCLPVSVEHIPVPPKIVIIIIVIIIMIIIIIINITSGCPCHVRAGRSCP